MAKCDSFQTQLTTIMDIMTKTALAQICKLFEEDSSKSRKEMLRVMKENSVLQDRLRCMENELKNTRRVEKGVLKHTKTYHTIGIQTGESHRGVDRENTGGLLLSFLDMRAASVVMHTSTQLQHGCSDVFIVR